MLAVTVVIGLPPPKETAAGEADAVRQGEEPLALLMADSEFDPLAGANSYDLYLNGIQLGKATFEVKKQGEDLVIEVAGKVRSFINRLFTIRYRGQAVLSFHSVQPSEAMIEEQKGSNTRTYQMKFLEPNRAHTVQIEEKSGKRPSSTQKEFVSENLVLDPFSTVFFIRSLDWRLGDVQVFDILTGRKQYELQLDCRGETRISIDGRMRDAWEIVVESRSIEEPRKVRLSGVIYLSKDSSREILQATGKHKIGSVVASMRRPEGPQIE